MLQKRRKAQGPRGVAHGGRQGHSARARTLSPMVVASDWPAGLFFATWMTALSWMLQDSPTVMLFTSPRSVAPYHTLVRSPSVTSPMTAAFGATKFVAG